MDCVAVVVVAVGPLAVETVGPDAAAVEFVVLDVESCFLILYLFKHLYLLFF